MRTMASLISNNAWSEKRSRMRRLPLVTDRNLFRVPLGVDLRDALNELAGLGEIFLNGLHPAATSFCSNSSLSCK